MGNTLVIAWYEVPDEIFRITPQLLNEILPIYNCSTILLEIVSFLDIFFNIVSSTIENFLFLDMQRKILFILYFEKKIKQFSYVLLRIEY